MKLLTLIVHTHVQQDLTELLRSMDQVPGFTFSQVEGYGDEVENDPFVSARDAVLGHIPRIRADILLEDNDVKEVLSSLRTQHSNITGQGVFWVTDVITGGHIL